MKKLFLFVMSFFYITTLFAEDGGVDQYGYRYCKNYNDNKCKLTFCEDCGKYKYFNPDKCKDEDVTGSEQVTCSASIVSPLTFSYIHNVTEYTSTTNQSGCGSCSGGKTKEATIPTLHLERFHKFRQMGDRGSFGMGVFTNFDIYFKLYESGGTPRVDMFFAGDANNRRYFKQGNKFFDTFARSSKELVLFDINDAITTTMADAVRAELRNFNNQVFNFDIFSEDAQTKWARLKSYVNNVGYKVELEYLHDTNATVDYDDKFKLDYIKDANNRQLTFEYLAGTRMGVNVVSKITLPNGSFIIYKYGEADPTAHTSDALSEVHYPDGTISTFNVPAPVNNETEIEIFEAGEKGTHRNKKAKLTNQFSSTGNKARDGQSYFNDASLLIRKVSIGDSEESIYEIYQSPTSGNNRRVFEGGNKLKTVNIVSAQYYKQWSKTGTNDNFDDFTGLQGEESSAQGDWKFYSGNAQGRPPLMFTKEGLKEEYVYNGDNKLVKKIFEDGTFIAKSYNEINMLTRERDRLGRVTKYVYDEDNPSLLESKTVGLMAQPSGTANVETPGLLARVYDWTGDLLPTNFESMSPLETVGVPNLELNISDRDERYAMLFTGKIEITNAGDYDFFLSSDDGSKLYIDGVEVIDNDGLHGNTEIATVTPITLTAGKHDIRVEFFEKYGLQVLSLSYSGPDSGNTKVQIPDSVYSHVTIDDELQEEDVTTPETATYLYTYYPSTHANKFLLHTETDANGNVTEYLYNSDNLLTHIKIPTDDGSGQITKSFFTYDSAKRVETSTDAANRKTEYFYDSRDRTSKITYSDSSTELFFYGSGLNANLLIKQKDRNGNTTTYEYDSQGRVETTINAYSVMNKDGTSEVENPTTLQSVEICTYVPGTELKATCKVDGELTEYYYDYRNRLVETKRHVDNNSILTTKSFFKNNLVQWKEDPYGRRTYFSYRITGPDKSDTTMTRMVKETIPGAISLPNGYYSDINNVDYNHSQNAPYLLTKFEKDAEGQTIAVIDPREIRHETDYDSRGRVRFQINASETLAQKSETIYDANSNVIEVRNPRYFSEIINDRTVMTYTARNLLATRTVASGSLIADTESFTYYADGRAQNHTDFRGNTSTKVWKQCCGRLGVIAGPVFTDKDNNQRRTAQVMEYDYFGNLTHSATLNWDANAALPPCCYPDPLNSATIKETTIKYDSRHRPISETVWLQPLGTVDPNNVPITTDPTQGLTTSYKYFDELNGHVELSEIVAELSADAIILGVPGADEAQGSAVIMTNPEGEKSVYIMDGAGRKVASGMLSKIDGSLVSWRTVTHDTVVNNLLEIKTTSALNNENKVHIDGSGRRIKTFDAAGNFTEFKYDNNSNLVYSKDANDVEKFCDFDDLDRDILCKDTVENALGVSRQKVYDLNNNLIRAIDAKGSSNLYSFDERNRKTNHWDRLVTNGFTESLLPAVADSTRYFYDANSNVNKITDVQGNDTVYVFDERNLNTQITYEDTGVTSCSYDALNRKDVSTDQLGDTVTYNYDLASRMTSREYHLTGNTLESTDTVTYDDASRVLTAHKGRYNNTCTYSYDEIGRKKTETTTVNGDSYTVTYDMYDSDNRIEAIYYPTGTDVQNNNLTNRNKLVQSYTNRNQLEALDFNSSNIITSTYDDGMRESTRTFGNNLVNNMSYNLDNTRNSISVAGKADISFTYGYDFNKNITSESSVGTAMSSYGFDTLFDAIDRVTQWDRDNAADSQTWTLDKIGNWDNTSGSFGGNSFNESRTHNDVHELTLMGGALVTYDNKGNMTTDANGNILVWDIDNHLKSFNSVTFTYDALGRRLEKSDGVNSTLFISNGQRVIEEYENSGSGYSLARSYTYSSYVDDLVAKIEANSGSPSILYYHSDREFNVRGLTDSSGSLKELYAYSVYGKPTIVSSTGATNNNYGFTGRYIDNETGLWYFRARYFSDEMGRFISRDPLGYVDGMSLYGGYFAEGFNLDPSGKANLPFYDNLLNNCKCDKPKIAAHKKAYKICVDEAELFIGELMIDLDKRFQDRIDFLDELEEKSHQDCERRFDKNSWFYWEKVEYCKGVVSAGNAYLRYASRVQYYTEAAALRLQLKEMIYECHKKYPCHDR